MADWNHKETASQGNLAMSLAQVTAHLLNDRQMTQAGVDFEVMDFIEAHGWEGFNDMQLVRDWFF